MPLQAGILVRISDDRAGDALGVERQEKDCRRLAKRKGWTVAKVYRENDTSAYKRRKVSLPDGTTALRVVRPEFRQMLADVADGTITALVAYDLDRVARDPRDLEDLIDAVEQQHLPTATVTGDTDLSSDNGVFMARMLVNVANKSSRDTSRRVRRAILQLAEDGKPSGGARPFGYEADRRTVRELEAESVRWAHAQIAAGRSLRSIGVDLARRYPERRWDADAVRRILTSPRYAALRVHRGAIVGPASWPAIVDPDTWRMTGLFLDDREHPNRQVGGARRYLLTGLLVCGRCGEDLGWPRLYPRRNAERQRFGCLPKPAGGCGGSIIVYDPTEMVVVAAALERLRRDADLKPVDLDDPSDSLRAEVGRLEAEQRRIGEAIGDDPSLLLTKLAATKRLSERIDTLRRQMVEVQRHARLDDPIEVAEAWDDYDTDQRRAVLDVLIDRVIVGPARNGARFDPTRLTVVWR